MDFGRATTSTSIEYHALRQSRSGGFPSNVTRSIIQPPSFLVSENSLDEPRIENRRVYPETSGNRRQSVQLQRCMHSGHSKNCSAEVSTLSSLQSAGKEGIGERRMVIRHQGPPSPPPEVSQCERSIFFNLKCSSGRFQVALPGVVRKLRIFDTSF